MLQKNGLKAKPSKCVWGMETVEYLGHRIGKLQVAVPEARTKAITKYRKPQKLSDIRVFLGVTGYYQKLIRNYALIAQPLSAALRKTKPKEIIWTSEREKAFYMLKKALCDVCHLTIPMPEDTYFVYIDASYMGISGVLNVSREGQELPVVFLSRELHLVKRIMHHQKLNVWQWLTKLDSLKFTWWEIIHSCG